ncbi:MAG: molybdopterin cofactor-binding domain-containing protein [Deinococcales bacterium]
MHSSTQHPAETQEVVAQVLGLPRHAVTVQSLRMGGGFGGKEVQANPYASVAALGAYLTKRPVRVRLNRSQDITLTASAIPFYGRISVAFEADGKIKALDASLYSVRVGVRICLHPFWLGLCFISTMPILSQS